MASEEILKAQLQDALSECHRLRDENAQLRQRMESREFAVPPRPASVSPPYRKPESSLAPITNKSLPEAKIALFRNLFRGRDDVYAVRWEAKGGKTGYAPAGSREWTQTPSTRFKKNHSVTQKYSRLAMKL